VILVNELLLVFSLIASTILAYMAVMTRDLVKAVIFLACQSVFFSIALYCMLAIDIVLVYLPVAVGVYSVVFLYAVRKTEAVEMAVAGRSITMLLAVAAGAVIATGLIMNAILNGLTAWTPSEMLRPLAKFIIRSTINSNETMYWTASPEAVTATVWDYRGLDTFFEIIVFYGALAGCLALFRFIDVVFSEKVKASTTAFGEKGLSIIAKVVCKVIFALISITAINIAVHGHLTPGGGFQGGAVYVVGPLLTMVALSHYFLRSLGYEERRLILLRSISLLAIALIALLPAILYGFIFQNQYKPWSTFTGYPPHIGYVWSSGSLMFFNILDCIAVATGFCVVFLVLSIPEEYFKELLRVRP